MMLIGLGIHPVGEAKLRARLADEVEQDEVRPSYDARVCGCTFAQQTDGSLTDSAARPRSTAAGSRSTNMFPSPPARPSIPLPSHAIWLMR
jgi:hypothetical protein